MGVSRYIRSSQPAMVLKIRHRAWIKHQDSSLGQSTVHDMMDCETFARLRDIPKEKLQCGGQYYKGKPAYNSFS